MDLRDLPDRPRRSRPSLWYTAVCLHNLGYVALHRQDIAQAEHSFHEALQLQRQIGNERGSAECLVGTAAVTAAHCEYCRADHLLTDGDHIFQRLGSQLDHTDQAEYDTTRTLIDTNLATPTAGVDSVSWTLVKPPGWKRWALCSRRSHRAGASCSHSLALSSVR